MLQTEKRVAFPSRVWLFIAGLATTAVVIPIGSTPTISAANSDPAWAQAQTQGVINGVANNTAHGYNNNWFGVQEIILQSVVGGPNGGQCTTTDTQPAVQYGINRASYNFPYINQGLDGAVA